MYVALFWGTVAPEWRTDEYQSIGLMMFERVQKAPGFIALHKLDVEGDGKELAVAYFESREAMRAWYHDEEHRVVEVLGHREILMDYKIEILELMHSYTKDSSTFVPTEAENLAADRLLARLGRAATP